MYTYIFCMYTYIYIERESTCPNMDPVLRPLLLADLDRS